jgi:hypothetical protein
MTPKWAPYSAAAGEVYPNEKWQKVETPEKLGWSSKKLAEARAYSKRIGSAAVMIVDNGVVVDAWGNTSRNFQCHSMRKSLISALIGIHVEEGNINLVKTMEDNTFEIWMNGNLLDTGKWWVKADKCWIKGKVITGGKKVYVYFVKDGDNIKWYDREGTLDGEGVYSRTN